MYDVFLSHSSKDKAAVEELARKLRGEAGLRPYLDKWHLVPGTPWQPELEAGLEESATAAVFFGPSGLGPWHHEEMRAALARAVQQRDDYRVIPVLLPGARREDVKGFLAQRMWVDFSAGLEDAEAFRRLVAGIKGQAPEVDSFRLEDSLAPYRGLLAFDEAHARFFFGRQAEVTAVFEKLGQRPFVAVVGASGVGKSSLVLAGVLPLLRKAEEGKGPALHVWVMRPGTRPLRALADQVVTLLPAEARLKEADSLEMRFEARGDGLRTALDTLCAGSPARCVLVVDQMEELFTLAPGEGGAGQVEAFLLNLKDAAEKGRGRLRILATLRADFLVRCLQFPTLTGLLQEGQVLLGSMGPEALRDVIVRPAQVVGVFLEKGVVSAILRDVAGQPGALPLLEYALDELWRAREGAWLKLSTYEASGGVWRALEKRAQATLESLPLRGQEVARRIFLRLTTLGEGTEDTRRRVAREELQFEDTTAEEVGEVLQRISGPEARLLVAEAEAVEVAHEVLIRQWPTLRRWMEEDRRKLRIHRRLTEAANEWASHGRDDSFLYSGARLLEAEEAFAAFSPLLNAREAEFWSTSLQSREMAIQREDERRRQELGQAQRLAQESAARAEAEEEKASAALRAKRRLWGVTGGLVLSVVLLAFFWRQARAAQAVSLSRELTAKALLQLHDDSQLSLLLIQKAQSVAPTEQISHAINEWATNRTLIVLRGHTDDVDAVAFSPDGARVVTASDDDTARVWEVATGRALATLSGHSGNVMAAAFSPDGARVVTASGDDTVRVWEVATGKALATLSEHIGNVRVVTFSPDGTRVFTLGSDGTVRALEVATGKLLTALSWDMGRVRATVLSSDEARSADAGEVAPKESPTSTYPVPYAVIMLEVVAALSPDCTRVVIENGDSTARVWEVATGQVLATLSTGIGIMTAAAFSADGTLVVTANMDGTASVWDVKTGQSLATFSGHTGAVTAVAFSPDGTRVVTASDDDTARVWVAATGKTLAILSGHTGNVTAAAFSPDGTRVVTANSDGTAHVWRVAMGESLAILSGHTDDVRAVAFSPDGTRVVTASDDDTAHVWVAATGKALATLSGHAGRVSSAVFSPDGTRVVTASSDDTARVWEAATGKALATLSGHTGNVTAAAFSPDGIRVVTVSDDDTVRVWEATGRALATLSGHADDVRAVAFSPDGARVVTASSDNTARVWDAATGKTLAVLSGHTERVRSAAFSPDGTRVVTASSDDTARVWEAATGKALATLSGHTGNVMAAAFSPDGAHVVTASSDDTARVWEAATGNVLATLSGHTGNVTTAAFSPDGARVVTASNDDTARVWETATGKALATLSGHIDNVAVAAFSSDGTRVVTADLESVVQVWHHALWTPEAVFKLRAEREFTCDERRQYLHEDVECPSAKATSASKTTVSADTP
jgi:WD40 repeat protein